MEDWSIGVMEYSKNGMLEYWNKWVEFINSSKLNLELT